MLLCTMLLLAPMTAQWRPMFDGKTLGKWKASEFPRSIASAVKVEAGAISLPAGAPMSGVTWTGEFPKSGYELRFEARRVKGGDFFASVTAPAGGAYCTWVLGGWGGDIVGISSIDGWDAADNETRSYFNFDDGRWYGFRLRVTEDRIEAWIDEQRVVNVEIKGRTVGLRRRDMDPSIPLGFASYNTAGGIRKIEYRPLSGKEAPH